MSQGISFFPDQSHTVVCKVSLFAFCFSSSEREKINLANLKLLVRLDILSPLQSDHFPEKRLVSKHMLQKIDKLIVPDGKICFSHLTRYFCHSYLYRFSWRMSSLF